jgi:hypothetical protein
MTIKEILIALWHCDEKSRACLLAALLLLLLLLHLTPQRAPSRLRFDKRL